MKIDSHFLFLSLPYQASNFSLTINNFFNTLHLSLYYIYYIRFYIEGHEINPAKKSARTSENPTLATWEISPLKDQLSSTQSPRCKGIGNFVFWWVGFDEHEINKSIYKVYI